MGHTARERSKVKGGAKRQYIVDEWVGGRGALVGWKRGLEG